MAAHLASLLEKTAREAALACGAILRKGYRQKLKVSEKQGAGLVTQIDLASEEKALRIFKRKTPDFSVLGEEQSFLDPHATPTITEGRWIIDPLDGTTNFVHRFPMFCVSIGAEWRGEIVTAAIYHPILDELYVASKGKGAYLVQGSRKTRLRVSKTRQLRNSLLTTGFSYQQNQLLHAEMKAFERLSQIARAVRRPGSAALDLAYTARGVFDGFWERNLSPWDTAAGFLLVEEAGGKVTDFEGRPYHVSSRQILAANPILHQSIRRTIAPQLCPL